MPIVIERYGPNVISAVHDFNQRLAAGAVAAEFRLPEGDASTGPRKEPRRPFEERFVAVDADVVRGGYILKHQDFIVQGALHSIAQYRLPISEGIIDRRHVGVGMRLLKHAMDVQPLLFALGMGSVEHALPRMLEALGWRRWTVPFYFRACHPSAVVKTLAAQRVARLPRLLSVPALARLAGLILGAVQISPRSARLREGLSSKIVGRFDECADVLWQQCAGQYTMIAIRSSEVLNALYPPGDPRFLRVAVYQDDAMVGWTVLLDTEMRQHRQFGDLRVGSIVDGLALPDHVGAVVAIAVSLLGKRGVDLIVSNQAHIAWTRAMRSAGLLRGPSNFFFACSPALRELLEPFEANQTHVHLTRGDGDGPIHL